MGRVVFLRAVCYGAITFLRHIFSFAPALAPINLLDPYYAETHVPGGGKSKANSYQNQVDKFMHSLKNTRIYCSFSRMSKYISR